MWLSDYYATLTFAIKLRTCYPLLKATWSQTSVNYLSLMNPWLYLLSTICAYSCNFPTPQVMLMMMIEMRTIAMSIRFEVNQSMFVPVWSFRREHCLLYAIIFVWDYVIYCVPLCNKHCNGTFEICLLMCATVSGAHMSLLCILFYS